MTTLPLVPGATRYLERPPSSGPWVAIGTDAWSLSDLKGGLPVMVIPPGRDPLAFRYPVAGKSVLLVQRGEAAGADVERAMLALLRAGAELVAALTPAGSIYCLPEVHRE